MRKRQILITKLLQFFAFIFLVGCKTPSTLRYDYKDYSEVYGEANNQQMLLNLAREEHEEPIYFIQLASISSQYQFVLGGGLSATSTRNYPSEYLSSYSTTTGATPPTGGTTTSSGFMAFMKYVFGISGSANGSFTETPVYQFVPLTGTNLSQAVLNPISDKIFYTFYDQDWPADWVARIMVESVVHENIYKVTNYITAITSVTIATRTSVTLKTNAISNSSNRIMYQYTPMSTNDSIKDANAVVIAIDRIPILMSNTYNQVSTTFSNEYAPTFQTSYITNSTQPTISVQFETNPITDSWAGMIPPRKITISTQSNTNVIMESGAYIVTQWETNTSIHSETNYDYALNDPMAPSYSRFLEYCEDLRFAQQYHMLNVDQGTGSNVVDAVEASKIKLADIVSAIGAGLSVRLRGSNEIVVSKPNQAFKFDYNEIPVPGLSWFTNSANVTHYSCVIARLTETFKKEQLATNLLYIDATNFFALSNNPDRFVEMERQYREEQRESQLETNNEYQNAKTWVSYMKAGHLAERIASDHITFKMRTFEAALFTVAGEERKFAYYTNPDKELLWTNLTFRAAKFGPIATLSREPGLSYNLRPILMLHYGPSERSQLKIVAQINHDGDAYTIGDLEGANDNCDPLIDGNFNFYQNRTVFSIINYLFLQTAINSQNLPVQQLIQVQ